MKLNIITCGIKYGKAPEGDIVFDVRDLTNPFWQNGLRALTGLDKEVGDFIEKDPKTAGILEGIKKRLDEEIGKTDKEELTIVLCCTGGQHRSVFVSEWLKEQYQKDHEVSIVHRDLVKRSE